DRREDSGERRREEDPPPRRAGEDARVRVGSGQVPRADASGRERRGERDGHSPEKGARRDLAREAVRAAGPEEEHGPRRRPARRSRGAGGRPRPVRGERQENREDGRSPEVRQEEMDEERGDRGNGLREARLRRRHRGDRRDRGRERAKQDRRQEESPAARERPAKHEVLDSAVQISELAQPGPSPLQRKGPGGASDALAPALSRGERGQIGHRCRSRTTRARSARTAAFRPSGARAATEASSSSSTSLREEGSPKSVAKLARWASR